MSATARSQPNIALIKYWGNRNNELRLPVANSVSMMLDHPTVEITVDEAARTSLRSFESDGTEREITERDLVRFERVLTQTRQYLRTMNMDSALPSALTIYVRSHIPPSIGLASSSAVFSCFARALAGLMQKRAHLSDQLVSVIARLGSGSAARSIFGGYGALIAGQGENLDSAVGKQIALSDHWLLHDIIIIFSTKEKEVGSTEGHALAHTSSLFSGRVEAIRTRRYQECVDAILQRDFEKLQRVAEEDCMNMHKVMETSTPPLTYLTTDTYRVVEAVKELRGSRHLPVLYTMDAGPTVHLLCTDEAKAEVLTFAKAQKGLMVLQARVGPGATLV